MLLRAMSQSPSSHAACRENLSADDMASESMQASGVGGSACRLRTSGFCFPTRCPFHLQAALTLVASLPPCLPASLPPCLPAHPYVPIFIQRLASVHDACLAGISLSCA